MNIGRLSLIAGLVGILVSSGSAQSLTPDWIVYLRRAGPVMIGMPIDEVRRVLDEPGAFLVQALKGGPDLPGESDNSRSRRPSGRLRLKPNVPPNTAMESTADKRGGSSPSR